MRTSRRKPGTRGKPWNIRFPAKIAVLLSVGERPTPDSRDTRYAAEMPSRFSSSQMALWQHRTAPSKGQSELRRNVRHGKVVHRKY